MPGEYENRPKRHPQAAGSCHKAPLRASTQGYRGADKILAENQGRMGLAIANVGVSAGRFRICAPSAVSAPSDRNPETD
jgi:hypothetical protein